MMKKTKADEIDLRITSSALLKGGVDLVQFVMLYLLKLEADVPKVISLLKEKGYVIDENLYNEAKITSSGLSRIDQVLADSAVTAKTDTQLYELAEKMKKIYPSGKKPGTDYYWSEGVLLIVRRLRTFFHKYGDFPDEDILEATRRYVEDKTDDPTMRLLRYFIFKDPVGGGNEVEPTSDLLTYLEHLNDEEEDERQWGENLR